MTELLILKFAYSYTCHDEVVFVVMMKGKMIKPAW